MQSVLITGGSRGIGRAMVELFASEGYRVAFTYRSSESEAKSLAEKTGALAIRADAESESEILSSVARAREALGGIDCLINNAAIAGFSLLTDITTAEWERFLRVNLTAPFLYSRAVLPDMIRRQRGRIVNISSMWGLVGASCEVHYSATKAGLIGFTKALAKEVGPSGITVNAIAPGVIATEMNRTLSAEDLAALKDETPLSRLGEPGEVARAALFLCSEGAGFITGEVMNISGGFVTP
ncbi:MAG: 3-oxoacyl-ACP reductase FabG [Clostridia bacterium]|nr:3-oxoacyl-ACP reductase FabG [Clostridia bacterium]